MVAEYDRADSSSAGDSARHRRIVVIGAGITGLSAAFRLQELQARQTVPAEIVVLEATSRVGGLFGSERIGEYLIELGADSFITNKPAAVRLCQRLGLESELIPTDDRYRRSLILFQGQPVETPEGFNLLAPGKWWPFLTTPLLSWAGKLRVAQELFIPKGPAEADESLADFVRRRFGNEVLERIVQPLVGGIYTSDPEKLSLRATLPRFIEMEQRYGSVIRGLRQQADRSREDSASGARYGLFASLRRGMSHLLETLQERVQRGSQLRFGVPVRTIERHPEVERGYRLQLSTGELLTADGLVLALPAHVSARLLSPLAEELAAELGGIEHASSAIVVSGHRLADIAHPLDAFGLVIPHVERRRILAVSFLHRKFPGRAPADRAILRTFVGGAMQPEEFERTDAEIETLVLQELREILGVTGTPDFVRIARYPQAMPQCHVGHLARVERIESLAARWPGLEVAGNFLHGVGLPDSVESGERAAERLWETLFPVPEMGVPVA